MIDRQTRGAQWAVAVLAAGRGTRMATTLPKPLHTLGGISLIQRVLKTINDAGLPDPTIVRDPSPAIQTALGLIYPYVIQQAPNGTGGALKDVLRESASAATHLLVINADVPLLMPESLIHLIDAHQQDSRPAVTLLTFDASEQSQAGRLARSADGHAAEIVEVADARHTDTPREGNAGVYALDGDWARGAVERLPLHDNGEYYITDLIALAVQDGRSVETLSIDETEAIGINTLEDLAQAEQVVRSRTLRTLMLGGVTIQDPTTTYIDETVTIAPNTVLRPNTSITGLSTIGAGSDIGPDTHIHDSSIGGRCMVRGSWLSHVTLEDDVDVGPFAHLRPGTHIGQKAHIGSFGEVKASRIGSRSAMGHFGYVGDADIGDDVNIGAGTVTCNFDGQDKHRTVVGDGSFIGSGSMLVAPVSIGAGAYTAAGSVVTRNVAAGTTVAGAPARVLSR